MRWTVIFVSGPGVVVGVVLFYGGGVEPVGMVTPLDRLSRSSADIRRCI